MPRAVVPHQQPIKNIKLHAFGDASSKGVSTAVYAVVEQAGGVTQNIVAAKSHLAKHGLMIQRLKLVAAHMATNLIVNVQWALVRLDSTVPLYWIKVMGEYKQFVTNRVNKIQQHTKIQ